MNYASILAFVLGTVLAAASHAQEVDPKARLKTAEKMFADRCKKSREFIYRTAENVEGIFLMKVRPAGINYRDQYRMDDPYGNDHGGEAYIESFLRGKYATSSTKEQTAITPPRDAYLFVEAIDQLDGKRYRYTGALKAVGKQDTSAPNIQVEIKRNPDYDLNIYAFMLDRIPAPGALPRYGVTYDDISTREERDYWIAASSLKVIDLKTNEVMAERIGYMMDRGQGNDAGGRSPWLIAANTSCPLFSRSHGSTAQINQTETFVEKVLKPRGGK